MESYLTESDGLKKVYLNIEDLEMKDLTRESPAQQIDDFYWSNLDDTLLSLNRKSKSINDVETLSLSL